MTVGSFHVDLDSVWAAQGWQVELHSLVLDAARPAIPGELNLDTLATRDVIPKEAE
jgi:hypothetical protein